jgi:AcrR family transcriptional regulator
MAKPISERRGALRNSLIDIAETLIVRDGLSALKARNLASEAGCAVGAIYNVFGDLNELTLEVNARTFHRLGLDIADSQEETIDDPATCLIIMAHAYLDFAADNRNLWRALFEITRPEGETAPDWYLEEMEKLLAFIAPPLERTFPNMQRHDRVLMSRALFSSIHGIVWLGLDEASVGVPMDQLRHMIALVLAAVTNK